MLDRDLLYYGSLFACIAVGRYYKKLEDVEVKRNYGAGIGLMVTFLVCRHHAFYSLILVWGNVMIIKCSDKRYVNELSISFTWLYLAYTHVIVGWGDYAMYLNQILALRLVGLASEINMAEKERINASRVGFAADKGSKTATSEKSPAPVSASSSALNLTAQQTLLEVNAIDVCSYAYHFIGLHKGPYYRYKDYIYHFKSPFTKLGDFRLITTEKLKKILFYTIIYALLRIKFSPKMFNQDIFYSNNYFNTELRFLYNIPILFMFVIKNQIIVMLSTCVFTEAGFGVYPALCAAVPGHGPTANEKLLKLDSEAVTNADKFEYNFAILRCFDDKRLFIGPKMRDTLISWDMATRYWFYTYIFNNMPSIRKEVRSASAFAAWSIWAGLSVKNCILVATFWVWINLEHEFCVLWNTNDSPVKPAWNFGFSVMRLLCLLYLTPCLVIDDTFTVFRFYNSIYWIFHLLILAFTLFSISLFKMRLSHARQTMTPPPTAQTTPAATTT